MATNRNPGAYLTSAKLQMAAEVFLSRDEQIPGRSYNFLQHK